MLSSHNKKRGEILRTLLEGGLIADTYRLFQNDTLRKIYLDGCLPTESDECRIKVFDSANTVKFMQECLLACSNGMKDGK